MSEQNELPAGSVPLAGSLPVGNESKTVSPTYQSAPAIKITLPDGRVIGMETPKIPLASKIAGVLGSSALANSAAFESERLRVKSLLYITDIDGVPEPKIADPIMRDSLEQRLGDDVLDTLLVVWTDNFPPVNPLELKIVKKS